MSYEQHYKEHLASFYSWMFGDFEQAVGRQREFFERRGLLPHRTRTALDLGAGSGFQSLALRQLGFDVVAVDTSAELLGELSARDSTVQTHVRDIRDLSFLSGLHPELVICMGDTLTHLERVSEVGELANQVHRLLGPGGRLVLSFRDLSQQRLDTDRFIPVKQDDDRILTCFLEDEGASVRVTDLLHERGADGWRLRKSSYRKLKLGGALVQSLCEAAGFTVEAETLPSGLHVVIATRAA